MATTWKTSETPTAKNSANCNDDYITLERYEPNIGAPFKVVLIDAVQQQVSEDGKVLDTCIPNLDGLLKEVAFSRALQNRKFSPEDLKFVRKAVGLKAVDLADLLGVTPEHISRCESGGRTLSVAAEKLLRVIILKRRHNPAELANRLRHLLESDDADQNTIRKLRMLLDHYRMTVEEIETAIFDSNVATVHNIDEELCFEFRIVPPDPNILDDLEDVLDEMWKETRQMAA